MNREAIRSLAHVQHRKKFVLYQRLKILHVSCEICKSKWFDMKKKSLTLNPFAASYHRQKRNVEHYVADRKREEKKKLFNNHCPQSL